MYFLYPYFFLIINLSLSHSFFLVTFVYGIKPHNMNKKLIQSDINKKANINI